MDSVLEIEDLKYRWPNQSRDIIDIDRFHVEIGEKVFLYGPSGSGKSTLLNLIGGVMTPNTGKISVLGTAISQLPQANRDKFRGDHLGFIFQMFNLLPYFSAVENVVLPCQFSKIKRQKAMTESESLQQEAERLLAELNLTAELLREKNVTQLSVGQQQRVAVARALIGKPDLVIADEPTSALDADTREGFLDLLFEECHKNQTALIFVSHDKSLGGRFDRVVSLASINRISSIDPSEKGL